MREYETIFVLDSALDGDKVEGEINRVLKTIADNAGSVHEVQRWGRRRLAYPIRKKSDGIYTRVRFDGNNTVLTELDRKYQVNESMLRYMTVLIDHPFAQEVRPFGESSESADGDAAASGKGRRGKGPAWGSEDGPGNGDSEE